MSDDQMTTEMHEAETLHDPMEPPPTAHPEPISTPGTVCRRPSRWDQPPPLQMNNEERKEPGNFLALGISDDQIAIQKTAMGIQDAETLSSQVDPKAPGNVLVLGMSADQIALQNQMTPTGTQVAAMPPISKVFASTSNPKRRKTPRPTRYLQLPKMLSGPDYVVEHFMSPKVPPSLKRSARNPFGTDGDGTKPSRKRKRKTCPETAIKKKDTPSASSTPTDILNASLDSMGLKADKPQKKNKPGVRGQSIQQKTIKLDTAIIRIKKDTPCSSSTPTKFPNTSLDSTEPKADKPQKRNKPGVRGMSIPLKKIKSETAIIKKVTACSSSTPTKIARITKSSISKNPKTDKQKKRVSWDTAIDETSSRSLSVPSKLPQALISKKTNPKTEKQKKRNESAAPALSILPKSTATFRRQLIPILAMKNAPQAALQKPLDNEHRPFTRSATLASNFPESARISFEVSKDCRIGPIFDEVLVNSLPCYKYLSYPDGITRIVQDLISCAHRPEDAFNSLKVAGEGEPYTVITCFNKAKGEFECKKVPVVKNLNSAKAWLSDWLESVDCCKNLFVSSFIADQFICRQCFALNQGKELQIKMNNQRQQEQEKKAEEARLAEEEKRAEELAKAREELQKRMSEARKQRAEQKKIAQQEKQKRMAEARLKRRLMKEEKQKKEAEMKLREEEELRRIEEEKRKVAVEQKSFPNPVPPHPISAEADIKIEPEDEEEYINSSTVSMHALGEDRLIQNSTPNVSAPSFEPISKTRILANPALVAILTKELEEKAERLKEEREKEARDRQSVEGSVGSERSRADVIQDHFARYFR